MVTAVFQVNGVTKRKNYNQARPWVYDINMNPIADKDGIYKEFYEATPSGELKFQTVNEKAADYLEPGGTYKITIERLPS